MDPATPYVATREPMPHPERMRGVLIVQKPRARRARWERRIKAAVVLLSAGILGCFGLWTFFMLLYIIGGN